MIAEGIVRAFRELRVKVPVVVRLQGTNEARGREVLHKAELPIFAFANFENAVQRVGELAAATAAGDVDGGKGKYKGMYRHFRKVVPEKPVPSESPSPTKITTSA